MGGGKGGKSQTVGYKYYIGLHMILCYGEIDEVLQMQIGERVMYQSSNDGGPDANLTNTTTAVVSGKLNLFGGEEREGGVGAAGTFTFKGGSFGGGLFSKALQRIVAGNPSNAGGQIDCIMGSKLESQNNYLQNRLGNDIPAYRGTAQLVFRQFYFGQNPYVKDMKFKVSRYPDVILGGTFSAERRIGNDANPVQIIFECLTNPEWGMGYTSSDIDTPSFQSASTTLFNEGFGLSLVWGESQTIEDFIGQILNHINASLYLSLTSGQFVLKLIRADYVIGDLQLFDESNIVEMLNFGRKGWGETINEVTVVYTKQSTGDPVPVTIQDLANITIQGGQVINQKQEYPGITTSSLALKVAGRDLQSSSSPLAKVTIKVNREAWDLVPGAPIRLSWPKYGIVEVVFRVSSVDYGSQTDSFITINAVEDIFALPDAVYGEPQESGWVDTGVEPETPTNRKYVEANYWDIVQSQGETAAATFLDESPDDSFLLAVAGAPNDGHYNYQLYWKPDGSTANYDELTPGATPFSPVAAIEFDMTTGFDTTFTYTDALNLDDMAVGELMLIGDEYVQLYFLDQDTNTMSVYRGMNDTLPKAHVAGTPIYGFETDRSEGFVQFTQGEAIDIKMVTKTALGWLELDDATEDGYTFVGRVGMPYAPGNLRVEGLPAFQPVGMTSGVFNIQWSHRNRALQTGALVYQDDPSLTPDPNVEYTLRLYDDNDTLVQTVTGITDDFYDWTTEETDSGYVNRVNNRIRIELEANDIVTGKTSYDTHDYEFKRADYGYSYGEYYGGFP